MKIRNKKNAANYVNFRDNGNPQKTLVAAGTTVNIPAITKVTQIINFGDFKRGFFEIVEEAPVKVEESVESKSSSKKIISKNKSEDSFEKVEKEVKNYTDNEQ